MHDIVCSQCGAHDMVPFKPRPGSSVQCRTCFEKGRTSRAARPESPRWDIECAECGAPDKVPFEPRPDSRVLCRVCHESRDERRRSRKKRGVAERRTGKHIPSIDHGTRVSYPINCEKCGKFEVLDHVPRTTGPILCTECAEARFGRKWYHVKAKAASEEAPAPTRRPRRWVEEAEPDRERLAEFEKLSGTVKVRRN